MEIILLLLLVFMIIGSIIAIETKNLLSSVISVGVVGFSLSIIFLMLGAPDIAITQVVVEILILVVLIRATVTTDNTAIEGPRDNFPFVASLIFFGLFLMFAFFAVQELPKFGEPLMRVSKEYLRTGTEKTGAANIVTAVLLDFRAYDTLGEATVLFTAIIGSFVILRRRGRKGKAEVDKEKFGILDDEDIKKNRLEKEIKDTSKGMTPIVKTIVRFVIGIIVIFGAYIVLYGHVTPGGGFAGGVILASAYVLLTLAFGKEMGLSKMSNTAASLLDNSGALSFVIIGLLGFTGGYFFFNFLGKGVPFRLFSAGSIPLANIAIGVKVTASVFAIFMALSIFGRVIYKAAEGEESESEE